ncbi:MAG TPA: Spx/MgsR family RNA polymerase-binding regulatory protein [Oligoflexia bacterium]|nr:Spx/MgsR family RNA polymerase-binding regulatory protein [Oligoflexia bacterium]HMR23765.1 Spx/MgsR family RNA polymerase-binding regulatory protein [Oligoflexia bacterium]
METLKIYWHPNCSTCKKAVKFLDSNKLNYELIDLREKAPNKTELKTMMRNYPDAEKKLFNTSGQVYRENNYKEKILSLSKTDMVNELAQNGLLVKRPFLLKKDGLGQVGFKEEEWKKLLNLK